MSWPSKVILPEVASSSRITQRAMVDLPQPDSPTTPSVSPLCQREGDAVDRVDAADLLLEHDAAGDREVLDQILDHQQLVGHQHIRLASAGGTEALGGDPLDLVLLHGFVQVAALDVRRVARNRLELRLHSRGRCPSRSRTGG